MNFYWSLMQLMAEIVHVGDEMEAGDAGSSCSGVTSPVSGAEPAMPAYKTSRP